MEIMAGEAVTSLGLRYNTGGGGGLKEELIPKKGWPQRSE